MTETTTQLPAWLNDIRGYILDMDGVLFRGNTMIPEVPRFLETLELSNIPYMMATNNATATPDDYVAKLGGMGIEISREHVVTSALATGAYLRTTYPSGTRVYVVGMSALREAVFGDGYFVEDAEQAEVVISGADFQLVYESLRVACLLIRAGADYVATNADTTFPTEVGLVPGAGAIVAALVAATSVEPTIVGKPSPVMVESCLTMLDLAPDQAVMLGDRLDTDILAGERAGARTILVTTGISSPEDVERTGIRPSLIIPTLDPLSDAIAQAAARTSGHE